MADLKEQQHVRIMFCFELQENSIETIKILKVASGEQTGGRIQVFNSFPKLTSSVSSVERCSMLGHPSSSKPYENVVHAKGHVHGNRTITIHEVVNILGISFGSFQSILRERESWNMCQFANEFMPCTFSICFF